ncbi:alpha/beta-hydrolase [Choiromyces venosus 120613-1]|uniref:1-alkyl-2-acetylglycerophosphocholine esterase n=1 Tax=Choiromyces venosus 120613-1 TaxID=1336337 RepID=A0A3N4K253_9PEZI|nr:alpha/beta-hydrolase [Choiromyces venosus 120613-1]
MILKPLLNALCLSLPFFHHAAAIALPDPSGPNKIGTYNFFITDTSRNDVFAPTPQPRRILMTLYYPTTTSTYANFPHPEYVTPSIGAFYESYLGLPNGTFKSIIPNSYYGAPVKSRNVKLILFSPGFGASRQVYATLAEDLASHGYMVAALDATYDSPIVEFPDGTIAVSNANENLTMGEIEKYYDERVKDAVFVVKSFANVSLTSVIPGAGAKGLKVDRVGMFGHSLGGATSAGLMAADDSILGGVDLDGALFGSPITAGLKKPFVLFGAEGHNRTNDETWKSFWNSPSKGWKRELSLKDARHITFTDYPPLVEILGLKALFPKEVIEAVVGSIGGLRAMTIQRVYLKAFFDKVLSRCNDKLFDGPNTDYPEISFL